MDPLFAERPSNAMFLWDGDSPQVHTAPVFKKDQLTQLAMAVLSKPYKGRWDPDVQGYVFDDPEHRGASIAEVMYHRMAERAANGDMKAASDLLDRAIGKPKQAVESVTMNLSYTEFLEKEAQREMEAYNQQPNHSPTDDWMKSSATSTATPAYLAPMEDDYHLDDDLLQGI